MNKGLITISDTFYKNDWAFLSVIFRVFRPYHIEYRHYDNTWYFYGESDLFEEATENNIMPQYDVTFKNDNGSYTYKFEKIDRLCYSINEPGS